MEDITKELRGTKKIVMLDHDDLYASLVKMNDSVKFQSYIEKLVGFCKNNNITLLRARGIIFSDWLYIFNWFYVRKIISDFYDQMTVNVKRANGIYLI